MENVNALLERYKADPIACELIRALGVVALTPSIKDYLGKCDPMSLAQIERALAMTPPPVQRAPMTYKRAAQLALECQDGVNLSGILASFKAAVHEAIWPEARKRGHGTDWVNQNPICFMFLFKLMALNGHEPISLWEEYSNAERACKAIVQVEEIAEISAAIDATPEVKS